MNDLREALTELATERPDGVFSPFYVDRVQKVARWALEALDAADEMALESAGRGSK